MEDYYTNLSEQSPVMANHSEQSLILSPRTQVQAQTEAHARSQAQSRDMIYISAPVETEAHARSQEHARNMEKQYKYNTKPFNTDFKDVMKRIVKYLIVGLAVAFVAYYFIGRDKLTIKDVVYLGITAAFVFAIVDTLAPTVSLCN